MDFIVEDTGSNEINDEQKFKRKSKNDDNQLTKKSKLSNDTKSELYKPPTVEELNHLRETEILFNSNLFRLQTEELLKEVFVKEKRIKQIKVWIENFREEINKINDIQMKLSDANLILGQKSNVELEDILNEIVKNNPSDIKTDNDCLLHFVKPQSIKLSGLFNINAICKPTINVDINIIIPKSYFNERDYMNARYLTKLFLYLSYITTHLKNNTSLYKKMHYKYFNGNYLKPFLLIETNIHEAFFNIRVIPEQGTFKETKFLPEKKNLRSSYISLLSNSKGEEYSTPFYNSSVLNDIVIEENDKYQKDLLMNLKSIRDGIVLFKIWLNQRGFLNGFNEDLIYSFITYLVIKGKINKHMSSYQIIRNAWNYLANSSWDTQGIFLSESAYDLEKFHKYYDVVFIDRSGHFNIAYDLNINIYLKIKHEAKLAMKYLDDGKFNSFQSLFITKMPSYLLYDAVLNIKCDKSFEKIYNTIEIEKKYDYFSYKYPLIVKKILNYLKEGLSDRLDMMVPILNSDSHWEIGGPINRCDNSVLIGFNFNQFNLYKIIEKGPPTYDPAAEHFREFWGKQAELRRFKDGSITEAVYWSADTIQDKRKIFKEIINFVLETKLGLKNFSVSCDEFESVLKTSPHSGLEERNLKVINTFDELGKLLRGLTLPLNITAIQGISEVFSYSDAFPPVPTNYLGSKKDNVLTDNNILFKENCTLGISPQYVPVVEGIIQMAQHSKWPNDYKALCNLKTAFYIEISKQLMNEHNIKSNPKNDYLDVLYNGLVFRLTLFHVKQIIELKKVVDETGVLSYEDNEESIKQEQKFIMLPRLMGSLHGIHAQHPSFGPSTIIIKRWLRSQLIDKEHLPDIIIELLNAYLYLNCAPFYPSALPQVAFFRFLDMLANFNWTLQPIILNFNDEITREQMDEHESHFHKNRCDFSPLHIITPFDNFRSILTKYVPSQPILNRLKVLGTECMAVIKENASSQSLLNTAVFTIPNLNGYNVLIHLAPLLNPNTHQQISINHTNSNLKTNTYQENSRDKIPIIDFNPVELYLKELRENYGDFALFFHDSYGGNTIAVLWKPSVHEQEEFKVANIAGKKIIDGDKTTVNLDAIVEDFYILGAGLIRTIETK